jgi:hypothetical protein
MKDDSGSIISTAEEKIEHLRTHWSNIFSSKGFNEAAADHWFEKSYPAGQGLERFPDKHPDQWAIRRSDIRKAISLSNRSAPGPDGIPYKVWRLLGDTAVETLWQAAQELQRPDAPELLEQAYQDEEVYGFNSGLLFFCRKNVFFRR